MNIEDWLKSSEERLDSAGIGTARLDALVLVEDSTGKDRAWLLAHPEHKLTSQQVSKLANKLEMRARHEPLAYIRGKTEFYGRDFLIDKRVLEPRPESETMIDLVRKMASTESRVKDIVDVGTGSGALAITAKLEIPPAEVIAIDIDPKCLTVAKKNVIKHKVDIEFYQGNLLKPLVTRQLANLLTILANLPYVPDNFTINPAAMREPKSAIFGGQDGLEYYRQLFQQIREYNLRVEYVLTESMPPQHQKLMEIAKNQGFKQLKQDDFIQLFVNDKTTT